LQFHSTIGRSPRRLGPPAFLIALVFLPLLTGCNRDPNTEKQKYFESGNQYLESGQFAEAVIQFSNATRLDPTYAAAHFKLAESYLQMQRASDAYRELQRTIELDPRNSKAALDLGLLLIAGRGYERVPPIANRMLQQDPRNSDAHLLLSELHRAQGDSGSAIKEVQAAISLNSQDPQLYVQLAALQQAGGETGAAEGSLRKALVLNPRFVPAIQASADLEERTGKLTGAEQQWRSLIQLQPKALEPRRRLAFLYRSQQRKAEAEQVMMQAKQELGQGSDHYRVLGEYYNSIGDADKALAEFAAISAAHPEDLRTREDYIRLLMSHSEVDQASKLNDAILKDNPNESGAQIIRGTILNSQGKFEAAAGILALAVKNAPQDPRGHYELGVAFSNTGYPERAQDEWQQAVELWPQMEEAELALAQVARLRSDHALERDTAGQLIRNHPSDPQGYILRAEAETALQQTKAAEGDLKMAIAASPRSAVAYAAMGSFLRKQSHNAQARDYYEKALLLQPGNIESLAGIATTLVDQKQTAKAIDRVHAQLAKAPNSDEIYALLGGLQVAANDTASAEASLKKATELNPRNLDALMLLAKVQMAGHEREESLANARRCADLNPKNPDGYYFAGSMEQLAGNLEQAEEQYRKALQVQPNYGPAANNLAYLMTQTHHDLDAALSLAQIAHQKMPDSPSAADTLGWVYYQKGLYGMAASLLQQALQKAPDSAVYHYHMGMVYDRQKNTSAARKHLQRALQIDPNSPDSKEIRRALERLS
jgi:tetratricopeptide (TPR) repeat protein